MNAIHNGILTYSARNGDVAGMMNISSMMALEKQRLAQASAALISPHFLPTLHYSDGHYDGDFPNYVAMCPD